jgi:ubiquitin-protein ligase
MRFQRINFAFLSLLAMLVAQITGTFAEEGNRAYSNTMIWKSTKVLKATQKVYVPESWSLECLRGGGEGDNENQISKIALKRLPKELASLENDPPAGFRARPLDHDILDWHFVVTGLKGSDFDRGLYHGRLILDKDYPLKPSRVMLFTKNGRFTPGQAICLSFSSYHPERWLPSWTVRTCIEALQYFMATDEAGIAAISAEQCPPSKRRELARLSQTCLTEIVQLSSCPSYQQILELHKSLHESMQRALYKP